MENKEDEKLELSSISTISSVDWSKELQENPKYSLIADPTGTLKLTRLEKEFVKNYIQYRNIPLSARIAGISEDEGIKLFNDKRIEGEIRRINLAYSEWRIHGQMLGIDEIGSYLSTWLLEVNVPEADKLKPKDKIAVANSIIELNKFKYNALNNPNSNAAKVIEGDIIDFEKEVEDMSIDEMNKRLKEIGQKLNSKPKKLTKEEQQQLAIENLRKEELIRQITNDAILDPMDKDFLNKCSLEQLEKMLKDNQTKLEELNKEDESDETRNKSN